MLEVNVSIPSAFFVLMIKNGVHLGTYHYTDGHYHVSAGLNLDGEIMLGVQAESEYRKYVKKRLDETGVATDTSNHFFLNKKMDGWVRKTITR